MKKNTKSIIKNTVSIQSCIPCHDCADGCGFFHNEVQIVVDKRRRKVKGLVFDTHPVVCGGECHKPCVTDFDIIALLKSIGKYK